jgi:serine protease inhibitor
MLCKEYIKVSEESTEATAVVITKSVGIVETGLVFYVNHPFISLITEKNSGGVLFAG